MSAIRTSTHWGACGFLVSCIGCGGTEGTDEVNTRTQSRDVSSARGERLEANRIRIRRHFEDKRAKLNIVATTMTKAGQIIDWTVPEEDPVDYPIHWPEPLPPLPEGVSYAQSPLETEPEARGPEGTVPNIRPDVEELLRAWGDRVPDDPARILDIYPPPNPDGNHRYHAERAARNGTWLGMEGRISVWDVGTLGAPPNPRPPNNVSVDTSIMQIFLGAGDGTGKRKDTLEAGKVQFYSTSAAGDDPLFFVYFTNSNYQTANTGFCQGGYLLFGGGNSDKGWTPAASPTWTPGMKIPASSISSIGNVKAIHTLFVRANNRWYVYVNGTVSGYFSNTCAGGLTMWHASDGTGAAGLRDYATDPRWYGEVNDSSASCTAPEFQAGTCTVATTTDMGNGRKAADPDAAWIDTMKMRALDNTIIQFDQYTALRTRFTTDANCYNQSLIVNNGFYMGGSGTTEAGCD